MFRVLLRSVLGVLGVGVAVIVLLMGGITWYGLSSEARVSDVGVVLGTTVHPNGQVSDYLRARLEHTGKLYQDKLFSKIIVTGATGVEGINEAQAMSHYLQTQWLIPSKDIILDREGYNTWLSAEHTSVVASQYGFKRVVIVSQFFHLARSYLAFHEAGVLGISTSAPRVFFFRDIYSTFREAVALPVYWFDHALLDE